MIYNIGGSVNSTSTVFSTVRLTDGLYFSARSVLSVFFLRFSPFSLLHLSRKFSILLLRFSDLHPFNRHPVTSEKSFPLLHAAVFYKFIADPTLHQNKFGVSSNPFFHLHQLFSAKRIAGVFCAWLDLLCIANYSSCNPYKKNTDSLQDSSGCLK